LSEDGSANIEHRRRHSGRHRLVRAVVLVVVLAGLAILLKGPCTRYYLTRFRGADPLFAITERIERLTEIWASLCAYRSEFGEFPRSMHEWQRFDPRASELLLAPRWSRSGDYVIDFECLHAGEPCVVVEDPGIRWPGDPDNPLESFRTALTNCGHLVYYPDLTTLREDLSLFIQCADED